MLNKTILARNRDAVGTGFDRSQRTVPVTVNQQKLQTNVKIIWIVEEDSNGLKMY